MKLPKGVVKGVKDDFDLEKADFKIKQQELEIQRLRNQLNRQRFYSLSEDEINGVKRTFEALGYNMFWMFGTNPNEELFIKKYLEVRDEEEKRNMFQRLDIEDGELPF